VAAPEADAHAHVEGSSPTASAGGLPPGSLEVALVDRVADVDAAAVALRAMRFGRLVERQLQGLLRPSGLDRSEFSVLAALLLGPGEGGQTPSELARTVVQTTSGMTKTVNRLTKRGLVQRTVDPADGRSVNVTLTDVGQEAASKLLDELVTGFGEALEGGGPDARPLLAAALASVLPELERAAGVRLL
jgi:DNA-binding MarR family transcriptional regulator